MKGASLKESAAEEGLFQVIKHASSWDIEDPIIYTGYAGLVEGVIGKLPFW